ncbi:MAG: ABC-2 type transport system ATP-binding protein [Planctomycetota bacterium]|jgi:ABC-2 type transport system ATP-binding protein
MRPALEVNGLTRSFGKFTAIRDIEFRVMPGQICGFIGPNGAGKTTTMRICATLDLPDDGEVSVGGRSVLEDPAGVRARLGFMPDSFGTYVNTTVLDHLDFFARAYGLRGAERRRSLARLIEFTNLEGLLNKETRALSKGMKQRLCLAKTLLHDPEVLILDEPAAGLDPRARIELRELVRALAGMGKAVLISSHILSELSELCDSVVVIESGRIRATGNVQEVVRNLRRAASGAGEKGPEDPTEEVLRVFLRTMAPAEALERTLLEFPGIAQATVERLGVACEIKGGEASLARIVAALSQAGTPPVEVVLEGMDLEDVFLHLTEGRVQ